MKIAKLFIKGIREPFELTEEYGRIAQQIKSSEGDFVGLTDRDTVSVGDIWTGEKGDLRYVTFETIRGEGEGGFSEYTPSELYKFEEELNSYLIKEDDEQFNHWVERFVKEVLDLKSKLFWAETTKERILGIRERCGSNEEKIKQEVITFVKERFVGTLSEKGELRYLADNKTIRIHENGRDFSIIQWADKQIPYKELFNKIEQYKRWKGRREYAKEKQMEGIEELAQGMTIESEDDF